MGQEFGQTREWDFNGSLSWHELDQPLHRGLRDCLRDLNRLHRRIPALYARDCEPEGFRWIVPNDRDQSVFAWLRFGAPGPPRWPCSAISPRCRAMAIASACLPRGSGARSSIPTAPAYGGSGQGNLGQVTARDSPSHGLPASAEVTIPPLATVMFQLEGE